MSGASSYVPNPDDATQPTGSVLASTAAAEFRALKGKVDTLSTVEVTWNPADKGPSVFLAAGNLLALMTNPPSNNTQSGRATIGKSGGQTYYYEYTIGTVTNEMAVGLATIYENVFLPGGTFLGFTNQSIGYHANGNIWFNGAIHATVAPYVQGDIIGVTFAPNDVVIFSRNGTQVATIAGFWSAGAIALAKYPAYSLTGYGDDVVVNFGASAFFYSSGSPGAIPIYSAPSYPSGPQNILINADFAFDQWNNRAALTPAVSGNYVCDRWRYSGTVAAQVNSQCLLSNLGDLQQTKGLVAYQRFISLNNYALLAADVFFMEQRIEGSRLNKLNYGLGGGAQTTTLLFYARSSLTGLFSGSIQNTAANRSLVFSFSIPTPNIWQRYAIIIPACIDGVWAIDTSQAASLRISLGVGSTKSTNLIGWQAADFVANNGAVGIVTAVGSTLDITGVEWKPGQYVVTSPPELVDPSSELLDCQRYYQQIAVRNAGNGGAGVNESQLIYLPTKMRVAPGATITNNANTNCANSTATIVSSQSVTIDTVVAAGGAFIQQCNAALSAEL